MPLHRFQQERIQGKIISLIMLSIILLQGNICALIDLARAAV